MLVSNGNIFLANQQDFTFVICINNSKQYLYFDIILILFFTHLFTLQITVNRLHCVFFWH